MLTVFLINDKIWNKIDKLKYQNNESGVCIKADGIRNVTFFLELNYSISQFVIEGWNKKLSPVNSKFTQYDN